MLKRDLITFKRHSVLIRDLITWANKRPMQLHVNRIGDFLTSKRCSVFTEEPVDL